MSFLRDLFGPSKQEIWQQFAAAVGGTMTQGSFWNGTGDKVEAAHGQWIVTLDSYTVSTGKSTMTITRMRAPYVNPDGFRFTVYRKSIFSGIAKWFGMQDINVGDPSFDDEFIIQGNDEARVRRLLAVPRLRYLIRLQPNIHFSVRHEGDSFWSTRNFPPNVDELYFEVVGLITDMDRLKQLYDLFSETLDELCKMGSAYKDDPGIRL